MADQIVTSIGVALVIIGFAVVFIAMIWMILSGAKGGKEKSRVGGVVIIGPVPIIFGTDKESVKIILLLSIALVVSLLVFMLFSNGIIK